MVRYTQIIDTLLGKTDRVILFHSGTGKDSIMLLDLLSSKFKEVQCVFCYFVPDLDYENRYIRWAERRYPNCNFIKTVSPAVSTFIRSGYMGIEKDKTQKRVSLMALDKHIRERTGIEWSVYGFKKTDGLNRRLMLNTYPLGIMYKTQKVYPLMDYSNKDVLNYIAENNIIQPFNYSKTKPSSGCDISQPEFLAYIRDHYPTDLQKIFQQYPFTEVTLFKYDQYGTEAKRNNHNQT